MVTDLHRHIELLFVHEFRWVSPLHFVKEWQNAVPLWCMLQVGPPSLHYCCAVVLRFSIVLPPVGHSSNHEYHFCQLRGQSSGVSNFYHTFNFSFDSPSYLCSKLAWQIYSMLWLIDVRTKGMNLPITQFMEPGQLSIGMALWLIGFPFSVGWEDYPVLHRSSLDLSPVFYPVGTRSRQLTIASKWGCEQKLCPVVGSDNIIQYTFVF